MKKLLSALLLMWAVIGYAQSFKSGYIITNENDTIHGAIKYLNSNASAFRCVFQQSEAAEEKEYTPNNIKGYRFENGKYYVSKSVNFEGKTQPFFLEFIVDGIVDLYCLYQSNTPHYFVSDDNGIYYLPNQENFYYKNGKEYRRNDTRYIGILKNIFKESPTVIKKAETTNLNHESLIQISKEYHAAVCDGEKCIVYKKEKIPRTKKLGIQYGYNALKIYTNSTFKYPRNYLSKFETKYVTFNTFGFFFQWNFPKLNENIFFQYSYMGGKVFHKGITHFASYTSHGSDTITLDQKLSFHTLSIQYVFVGKYINPYVKIGGSVNGANFDYTLYHDGREYNEHHFTNGFNSLSAAVGFNIKIIPQLEFNIDAQYQFGTGYYSDFKISHIALQSGIAFVF